MMFQPETRWDRLGDFQQFVREMLKKKDGEPDTDITSEEISTLLRREYGTDKGLYEKFGGNYVLRRALVDPEAPLQKIMVEPKKTYDMSCQDKLYVIKGIFQGYSFAAGLKSRRDAHALARRKKRLVRQHIGVKTYSQMRDRFLAAMKEGA